MTGKTKILISQPELELVMNGQWILTKTRIINKVYELFAELAEDLKVLMKDHENDLPAEIMLKRPRIFKGENYKGLPYVILDHPVIFGRQDIFAIRTLFWWGNYFSIQLQLSGTYKGKYQESILKKLSNDPGSYFVAVSEDAWDHDLLSDGYKILGKLSPADIKNLAEKKFLKLALKFDLKDWNNITELIKPGYKEVLKLLED